jgi:hypothetical protein
MKLHFTLALLLATASLAPGADDLLATEIVHVFLGSKNIYNDDQVRNVSIELVKQAPTWDKARMTREFDAVWRAARNTNSSAVQPSLYKTATVILALNRPLGPQLASERLNEILDAIEAGSEPSRISLMEHLSMMKIPKVPEATLARMTKLAMAIQRFPGGLLYQCAVATNPASPAVEEVIFTVMKKPEGDNTMDMYGGYLNGIRGQKQNPGVRVMLQKLTTVDNEQVRKAAQAGLNEPPKKTP